MVAISKLHGIFERECDVLKLIHVCIYVYIYRYIYKSSSTWRIYFIYYVLYIIFVVRKGRREEGGISTLFYWFSKQHTPIIKSLIQIGGRRFFLIEKWIVGRGIFNGKGGIYLSYPIISHLLSPLSINQSIITLRSLFSRGKVGLDVWWLYAYI